MWKTTLIFLAAVLLTVLLTLTLGSCAWSCQPSITLNENARMMRAGMGDCIEQVGLNCHREF